MSLDIRLLVVCDGQLRFGEGSSLSLSLCLQTLQREVAEALPGCQLRVTTVYRRGAHPLHPEVHGADLTVDRFESQMLEDCDVVWLFGHEWGAASLATAERQVFLQFLASGGGVFATGDHGAMGRALCGGLPFIDAMRSWDGLDEQGRSVDEQRPYSVDTRSPGDPRAVVENAPETDFPCKTVFPSFVRLGSMRHPHPLMSLPPDRVIRTLPQHRHEGVCFHGEVSAVGADGPVCGEARLIARAMTLPGQDGNCLIYEPRCVGVVSVMDSPASGWGRCAVDSTFHHFIDTNIRHVLEGGGDAAGDLRRYYLNLLLWLYLGGPGRNRAVRGSFAADTESPQERIARSLSASWWAAIS